MPSTLTDNSTSQITHTHTHSSCTTAYNKHIDSQVACSQSVNTCSRTISLNGSWLRSCTTGHKVCPSKAEWQLLDVLKGLTTTGTVCPLVSGKSMQMFIPQTASQRVRKGLVSCQSSEEDYTDTTLHTFASLTDGHKVTCICMPANAARNKLMQAGSIIYQYSLITPYVIHTFWNPLQYLT